VNATVAFTLAVLFLILRQTKTEIDSTTGLWIYAASNITGAVIGLMLARLPLHALKASALAVDAREAWRGGKWALNGTSISWLQSQAYMYITAILAGPVGVAHANAARLFITPAAVLMPALSQVVMPRFATQFSTHPEKIRPIWSLFTVGLIIAAIFYSAILLSTADIVTPLLLNEEYEHITPLIAAWCLLLIFQFSLGGTSIVLQIMKLFKTLTILNVKSACLAIAAVFVLTKMFGVQGAILGAAAGELALSVLMYQAVKQKFRNTVKSIK
jgi:O-antigen/teichoic acid export membrane protein